MTVSVFALAAATLHTMPSLTIRNGRRTLETKGARYTEGDIVEVDGNQLRVSKVSYDGVSFTPIPSRRRKRRG